ncbi:NAD-dependent epimerase/dehydratase family protein [Bdellovibrionota bacterium FG-2]
MAKIAVTGGAGFIGSNLVDRLMALGHSVLVVDNLSGGQKAFISHHLPSKRFCFVKLDVRDTKKLRAALDPSIDLIYHLAANADIARGVDDPTLDFEHSIVATFSLLQAMRHHGIRKLVYTSGSGVYGDRGLKRSGEDFGPLEPVSMYGASKLGAEGLISAFVHLFEMQAWILRPANITGPRTTHGVVFDFVKRLKADPTALRILGDGKQNKAYLHVHDVIDALILVPQKGREKVNFYNLSSNSYITVNRIAELVVRTMGLKGVKLNRTGGKIGWKGDVAIVRLHNRRITKIGWRAKFSSAETVEATIKSLLKDPRILRIKSAVR